MILFLRGFSFFAGENCWRCCGQATWMIWILTWPVKSSRVLAFWAALSLFLHPKSDENPVQKDVISTKKNMKTVPVLPVLLFVSLCDLSYSF
jgi:hypothetical protein